MANSDPSTATKQVFDMRLRELEGKMGSTLSSVHNAESALRINTTSLNSLTTRQETMRNDVVGIHNDIGALQQTINEVNDGLKRIGRVVNGRGRQDEDNIEQNQDMEVDNPTLPTAPGRRPTTYKGPPSYLTFALKETETWHQFK